MSIATLGISTSNFRPYSFGVGFSTAVELILDVIVTLRPVILATVKLQPTVNATVLLRPAIELALLLEPSVQALVSLGPVVDAAVMLEVVEGGEE